MFKAILARPGCFKPSGISIRVVTRFNMYLTNTLIGVSCVLLLTSPKMSRAVSRIGIVMVQVKVSTIRNWLSSALSLLWKAQLLDYEIGVSIGDLSIGLRPK